MLERALRGAEPRLLAGLGFEWRNGIEPPKAETEKIVTADAVITNATIDAIVGGQRDKDVRAVWQKITGAKSRHSSCGVALYRYRGRLGDARSPADARGTRRHEFPAQ